MSEPQGATQAQELPESLRVIVDAVEDVKATDLLVLDLRQLASFTDYLVICTGSSDRHVQAVVDAVRDKLREIDVRPLHTEGYEQASWVLVDFVDFLVNVFTPETRDFYQLERVWRDAPALVGERPATAAEADDDGDAGDGSAAVAETAADDAKAAGPRAGDAADG